ncbi:hypothetical protein GCM10023186_17180 [Hymenobacter koreensis]|uniref:histidine kinase n=1 Tax=Hymenobacter koreensis TaxID=1084523 RepID=A0ABP8IY37_9BACT
MDAAGCVQFLNESYCRLWGLAEGAAYWTGQPADRLRAVVQTMVAESEAFRRRTESWRADGEPDPRYPVALADGRWLELDFVPLQVPAAGLLVYVRDVTERHRAEAKLAEQRRFYESVLNEIPSQIAVFRPDGRYLFLNAQAVPDAGARAALLDQFVDAYVAHQGWQADIAAARRAHFRRAVAELRPQSWQETTPENDGPPRHYLRHYQPVRDAAGALQYVIGYGTDITARVAAEEAVQASEARLREQQQFMQQLLDTTRSVVYVRDPDGDILFANPAMRELQTQMGATEELPEPLQDQRLQELASYAALDARVLATGQTLDAEDLLTMPDGSARWFYTVKSPLPRCGASPHVLGVSTDITALKQAQITLMGSEKRYRDLMQYAQALICTYDLQGTVLSANPALSRLLDRPETELLGCSVSQFMLPEDQPHFDAYLAQMAREGEAQGVLRVRPSGSAQVHHLLYHNFVMREHGQAPYIISHAHDITNRVLAEQQMKQAKEAAEAAAQARENFLANMSHEIRTPLNGVLGIAAQLGKTPLDARQQELLQVVQASGRHLLGVLNDVLDMAKISSGKLELVSESFDVCEMLYEAARPLFAQAQEKGIEVEAIRLHESCPNSWVVGDAHRLRQVILNLFSNAIKFTPPGGRITAGGYQVAETADTITVEFRFSDTGVGIPADKLAHIFDSFAQAQADTARRFGGTGLGLSISRALIEQMGGSLTVESTEGKGSTFAFAITLPRAAQAQAAVAASAAVGVGLQGMRLLLVEDNETNRLLARMILEDWGVELDEAEDGEQGVALAAAADYDAILMDIQMPGLNGLQATAAIRALPDQRRASVPIVALTANAFESDTQQYLAAGMQACVAKPFDENELFQTLDRVLSIKRQTS